MDKTCSICLDTIDEPNLYTLMPCQHEFHADCIVNWFRKKEDSCPYCRDKPNQEKEEVINLLTYVNNFQYLAPVYKSFGYASSQARRKDASKKLHKIYGTYKKYKANYAVSCRAVKEFRNETGTFRELRKRSRQLRRAKRLWGRNMNRVKRQMRSMFPDE